MTTTVTTTTTTTFLTYGAALGLLLTLVLIGMLVIKEMVSAGNGARTLRWGRVLNVGIVPLLISFVCIAGLKITSVL